MEAIVCYENIKESVALRACEMKEVHGAVVHSHHGTYYCRFSYVEENVVGRNGIDERAASEVEEAAFGIMVKVGHEA